MPWRAEHASSAAAQRRDADPGHPEVVRARMAACPIASTASAGTVSRTCAPRRAGRPGRPARATPPRTGGRATGRGGDRVRHGNGQPGARAPRSGALRSGATPRALHQRRPRSIIRGGVGADGLVHSPPDPAEVGEAGAAEHLLHDSGHRACPRRRSRRGQECGWRPAASAGPRARRCLASMRDSSRSKAAEAAASEDPAGTFQRV